MELEFLRSPQGSDKFLEFLSLYWNLFSFHFFRPGPANELSQPIKFLAEQLRTHGVVGCVIDSRSEAGVELVNHLALVNRGLAFGQFSRGFFEVELHIIGRMQFTA